MAYTTIKKPSDYFNPVTWTGTGDATTSVTGVGFQPDFTWIKNRDVADDHMLFDAVRGVTKRLFSNSNGAEGTDAQTLTSFDSDGFTTGNSRATGGDAGNGMVSWNWLGSNTSASNTAGSITSTVSANTTSGFSIVSYTGNGTAGATIGHGLGNVPKMMIIKQYSSNGGTENWGVYHNSIGNGKYIFLNLNQSEATSTGYWNNTTPTSSVFTLGNNDVVNNNTVSYIAYCFAEKQGFSKFGSYTGNGNNDGTFVYTGFKPAFLMVRGTAVNSEWVMLDNKREPSNDGNYSALFANLANAEGSYILDTLSNGFKVRNTSGSFNTSGGTYTYMAFAAEPLVGDNPATAR